MDVLSLPVTGAEPRDLPGGEMISAHENFDKVWVTDPVRVFGIWRDGVIEYVLSIPTAEMRNSPWSTPSPVPCDPPTGVWPGNPDELDPFDPEGLVRRLESEVDRDPDLYGGLWTAVNENILGDAILRVMVVGTTGEVDAVEDRLRQIYPANLCVVQVENSTRELEAVAERLRGQEPEWYVEVDPGRNRVAVWLPVIDEEATALLEPDLGMLDVVPVAKRVDADPPEDGERICGVSANWCDILVALVREAHPELFGPESVEVAASGCDPGWASCPFSLPYIVVVIPPDCTGGPLGFSVQRPWRSTPNPVSEYDHALPTHVAELLPPSCAVEPPPSGERICGRLDQTQCDVVVGLVREARPDAFAADSVAIAEYTCAPGQRCPAVTSYIVAVVGAGCTSSPIAFTVRPQFEANRVLEYPYSLPPHVAELLPADCGAGPPP